MEGGSIGARGVESAWLTSDLLPNVKCLQMTVLALFFDEGVHTAGASAGIWSVLSNVERI